MIISAIAAVFGGIALFMVLAAVMFMATFWFLGQSGKPQYVVWDQTAAEIVNGPALAKVAPRIILRGERIEGACKYFLGLGITPDGLSTHARTVREEPEECRKVVEVWTGPQ